MMKWLKRTVVLLLVLLVLTVALALVMLRTEMGAGWVIGMAQNRVQDLSIESWQGSIYGGLELQEVRFAAPSMYLSAKHVRVAIRPQWNPLGARIEWLEAGDIVYQVLPADEPAESTGLPQSLELPFALELARVELTAISVLDEEGLELFSAQRFSASASAAENIELHAVEIEAQQGRLALNGRIALRQPFAFKLFLNSDAVLPMQEDQQGLAITVNAALEGTLEDFGLVLDGTLQPPGYAAHQVHSESRGSLAGLDVSRFELDGPDLRASGAAVANWEDLEVRLENVELELPGTTTRATVNLAADLAAESLEGRLEWENLVWPLRSDVPEYSSGQGAVQLSGTFDDWNVNGQADVEGAAYPGGHLQFEVNGNRDQMEVRIIEGAVLGGRIAGTAKYSWVEGGQIVAEISAENILTEAFSPDFPAVLSGDAAIEGRLEPLELALNIRGLEGTAMGRPVQASGLVQIRGGAVNAQDLKVSSGGSRLALDGYPEQEGGLRFDIDIVDLADFLPGSSGAIRARGMLSLQSGWPVLELQAEGSDMAWRDMRVASLIVRDSENAVAANSSALILELSDAYIAGTKVDQLTADLIMDPSRQFVKVAAQASDTRILAEISGSLQQASDALPQWLWTGQLKTAELSFQETHRIALDRPAPLAVSASSFSLEESCLSGPGDAHSCILATWSESGGLEMLARLERASLDSLRDLLGMDLVLTHQISGEVSLLQPPGRKPSGAGDFVLTSGTVSYVDDPDPLMETAQGTIGFTLQQGRLTRGRIDIPFTGQGVIDIDFDIPDVTAGLSSELQGRLLIDFDDLDILAVALPRADEISGSLFADLAVTGTVGQPNFRGRFDLSDGVLHNRVSGLRLNGIQLSGNLDASGESRLIGEFQAEEGTGTLEAQIDLRDLQAPEFELGVRGQNLKLFNSEDLVVVIDPDLSVAVKPGVITIGGEVTIPSALIAPAVIPEQTLSESTDLVIVAGQASGVEEVKNAAAPMEVLGDLTMKLGDDVQVDITVAKIGLKGQTNFYWQGDPLPMAQGGFSLFGEILAFGQLLEIAEGNISFPNAPANNPHLHIRAEREIYGNSEVRRAGLLVAGTVRRPVLEPYTDPMTNRDRAQTLLVTGSDFNMERGVGAVDIGTYIAPRIFVSYGVGVFDGENILSIRYDLGRGWGVKATSGERSTGIDMSYTLEH